MPLLQPFSNAAPRSYPGQYKARGARMQLCLLPESIESSAGTVTRWRDMSGYGRHATPTGSPATDTLSGLPCVVIDGVNDQFDGALVMADQPMTVFLLFANTQSSAASLPGGTGYAWIFDTAPTGGAADQSASIAQIYTSLVAKQPSADRAPYNGNAATTSSTSATVARLTFTTSGRSLYVNGAWKDANAIYSSSVASCALYRVGNHFGGGYRWGGKIAAVLVYSGLSDKESARIERLLMAAAGIAAPSFGWPLPDASATALPRWALPPVTYVLAGRATEISKYAVWYRDGTDASLRASIDGIELEKAPPHCWRFTPPAPGDYTMTFTAAGGLTASTVLRAIPVLTSGTKRIVLPIGTSNFKRLAAGQFETIARELGSSLVQFVGTQGPENGYSNKHEGIQSSTVDTFDSSGSPLWNGGGARDIAGYLLGLDALPTHIPIQLYQNLVHDAQPVDVDTAIAHTTDVVESFISDFAAELPGMRFGIFTEWMLNPDPSLFGGTSARNDFHERMHRVAEEVMAVFGDREDEGIDVIPTHLFTPFDGWDDGIHLNVLGQRQPAQATLAWLSRG